MENNYEQKYRKALDDARLMYDAGNNDVKHIVGQLFPELAESEDEKIRKELIKVFSNREKYCSDQSFGDITVSDALAWLEKQGEQKGLPKWEKNREGNKPQIKRSVLMLTKLGVAEGEWLGEEWCQYRWSCKVKDEEVLYWMMPISDLMKLEKEE